MQFFFCNNKEVFTTEFGPLGAPSKFAERAVLLQHGRSSGTTARKMPNEDSATPPLPDSRGTTTQWAGLHRMKGLLSPPTLSPAFNVEASIHKPPRMLRRDIELVFRPDLAAAHAREAAEGQSLDEYLAERLIAVPTWQPSKHDLSEMSFVVNEERRGLLLNFHAWVKGVRARLGDWWSDASDPLEGTALFGARTSCIYNELEGLTSLLRYACEP